MKSHDNEEFYLFSFLGQKKKKKKENEYSLIIYSPLCRWKVGWSFTIHKTFLELQNKHVMLQHYWIFFLFFYFGWTYPFHTKLCKQVVIMSAVSRSANPLSDEGTQPKTTTLKDWSDLKSEAQKKILPNSERDTDHWRVAQAGSAHWGHWYKDCTLRCAIVWHWAFGHRPGAKSQQFHLLDNLLSQHQKVGWLFTTNKLID